MAECKGPPDAIAQVDPARIKVAVELHAEDATLAAPSFTLRGGTREILRALLDGISVYRAKTVILDITSAVVTNATTLTITLTAGAKAARPRWPWT